ncbi:MAG: hypothetical protein PHD10_04240 [Bacilli bacterium]|nr:hypothetical protein [Bacilli bacterium]MDD4608318.1 hypothetical protein [Bacilli bacterium]
MAKKKISFPQFGNYCIPFEYLLTNILNVDYIIPPPTTKKTLELGSMHSPDFVCAPFKYQLGGYIEALEAGADVLFQVGGVCRLCYYGELHEQILKDLGYKFEFINFSNINIYNPVDIYNSFKKYNSKLSASNITVTLLICIEMVKMMDEMEIFIRENVGFEIENGSFDKIYNEFLDKIRQVKSKKELKKIYSIYYKKLKDNPVIKPKNPLKVGLIGEYYTVMEPFSNHFMEKELAKKGIVVTRTMNVSNTVFWLGREKELKKKVKGYLKYDIGATGIDTISEAIELAKKKYDGIIHVKSFGCTPEIDAMPVLQNISNDYKIPILYFSFDSQTSETGIQTRLEAFYDMITMRKEKNK